MSRASQTVLWIGGWAIPAAWGLSRVRERFPDMTHQWRVPGPDALLGAEGFDHLAGYSLGASLLLRAELGERALLLAPFTDFKKESDQGGQVSGTQLRHVRRWLVRDAQCALNDFYGRAGLDLHASELPYDWDALDWGLDQLMADVPASCAAGCTAIVGGEDPLLNPSGLVPYFLKIQQMEGVGHGLSELLQAMQGTHEIF